MYYQFDIPDPGAMISGSAAVSFNRGSVIYDERHCVVTTRNVGTDPASTLHCYNNDQLRRLWSYDIGRWTTSSPKNLVGRDEPLCLFRFW